MPNVSIRSWVSAHVIRARSPPESRDDRVITQAYHPAVDRHGDVDMRVGIDSDNHLPRLGLDRHVLVTGWPLWIMARWLARVG